MNNEEYLENIALKLSPKILQHISSNIYRQPASAFKELASNAFDASAENLEITFKIKLPDNESDENAELVAIEIKDDGDGMSREDFQSIFTNIGYSKKVRDLDYDSQDKLNEKMHTRPIIGRIGIGLFSVVAASDEFEIESKKENTTCYVAKTKLPDFARLNVTNIDLEQFETGDAEIWEKRDIDKETHSYTKITIQNFKKPFMEEMMDNFKKSQIFSMALESRSNRIELDYEEEFTTYLNKIQTSEKIESLDGNIDKFIYNLALELPIEYLSEGPFKKCVELKGPPGGEKPENIINEIKERLISYKFNVFFSMEFTNNKFGKYTIKLFKPVSFPAQRDIKEFGLDLLAPTAFLYKKTDNIPNEITDNVDIDISMYVYKQGRRIVPHELRGILFRVYDVAIGTYDYEKLRPYTTSTLQFQTSYEIFMNKGFQSAVNVDRESLYEASYSYRYLKRYFEFILGKEDKGKDEYFTSFKQNERGEHEGYPSDALTDDTGYGTANTTNDKQPEKSFNTKLDREFNSPNSQPLFRELNSLRMKVSNQNRKMKIAKQKNNPILSILKDKFQAELDTIDQIELKETKGITAIERSGKRVVLLTNFKPDRNIKLPFLDAVLLAYLKLKGEDKIEFLSALEELYKFYADK